MTKGEKTLFIFGLVFAAVALLAACFSAYFGVAAQIAVRAHGADPDLGTSIGYAFMVVFMILGSAVSWPCSVAAAIVLAVRPARMEHVRVRRTSRILIAAVAVMAVLQGVLWLLALI
ncbi:MAG: hypothetical protein IJW51_05845 [Clostridia bacterium]|nr:hypothetical protein [Clostridia bacterium]